MSTSSIARPADQQKRIRVIQVLSILAAGTLLFARPGWDQNSSAHEFIEMAGLALVLACIFGRLWSILYIGGRKNSELVTVGPYSMTRNPLYLSSLVGAVGIGLMFGSALLALLLGTIAYVVLARTASREEAYLRSSFGPAYDDYAARTPLFWPSPRLYRESTEVSFPPKALRRTFVDAMYFLMVFPLIEGLEYLQTSGYLPAAFHVY